MPDNKDNVVCRELVQSMIQFKPEERPCAATVLKHPFFWGLERQLAFFQDVSDRIEKEDENSPVVQNLEKNGLFVVKFDWRRNITQELQNEEVKASLGRVPDEFVQYFTSRFPRLLLHVYEAMEICKQETVFKQYYHLPEVSPESSAV
nr:hypothetical protein BaRGS_024397 [Batillaria attramentaria]